MAWITTLELLAKTPNLLLHRKVKFDFDGIPLVADNMTFPKIMNLLKAGLDGMLRLNRVHALPPIIQIEPTNICNLKCPLCPTGTDSSLRPKGFMSLETFNAILKDLEHVLIAAYLYSYGEPCMNKDLYRMVAACTRRNILTLTTTNGHFIRTPEDALSLVDAGLDVLIVAVDGSTQEIYAQYRKSGNLEQVKRCISLIEEAKVRRGVRFPYTAMRSVVMSQNQHDLANLEKLARRLGVNLFTCKSVGCLPDREEFQAYEPHAEKLRRFKKSRSGSHGAVKCPFPFRQPTVFWDGTVVGSEHDRELEMPLGKIGSKSFSEIWNGPQAVSLRRRVRNWEDRPLFCRTCPHEGRSQKGVELRHKEFKSTHC